MKRAKAKTGRKNLKRGSAGEGSRKPVDLAVIRGQIMSLVGHQALGMVEATIREAEKGHFTAMKVDDFVHLCVHRNYYNAYTFMGREGLAEAFYEAPANRWAALVKSVEGLHA